MDIATLAGLIAAIVLVCASIMVGGSLGAFIDIPSVLVVVCGSIAAMLVAYPGSRIKSAFKVAKNAFFTKPARAEEILVLMRDLAKRARREGVLALEEVGQNHEDDFVRRGIQMVVDGQTPESIEDVLFSEIDKIAERHAEGADIFDTLGSLAPAFGMIGTLIGLVQMLGNLDDPSKIGPAMAVALITTFYGSMIANIFAIPVAKKLRVRSATEVAEKTLVAQGLLSIVAGENPRFMADRLNAQLPPSQRLQEAG
ncbi:MAG: motility protein A [Pseudomonadota bacterium]